MAGLEGMKLGNYAIIQRIGSGGMGDIYLAEHADLGRRVAVKVVREAGGSNRDPEANRRFAHEARAVALLEHPHILPVYDYGEQDGIHYLVMQYVPDGSLADLLGPGPQHLLDLPLSPELTAHLIRQAAGALQYAHDRGVIHRDIKPHNLLVRVLSRTGVEGAGAPAKPLGAGAADDLHVLLADFGLARFLTELTGRTATTGTPLYTAPEQYHGRPVPASDQYALACVAYLLLAGRPVFDGTVVELHHQHLVVPPAPITSVSPLLPAALDAVLQRALEKDPQARFLTVADFGTALTEAIAPPSGVSAPPPPVGPGWQPPAPFGAPPSVPLSPQPVNPFAPPTTPPASPASPPAASPFTPPAASFILPTTPPASPFAPPTNPFAPPSTPFTQPAPQPANPFLLGTTPTVPGQPLPRFPALLTGAEVEAAAVTAPENMPPPGVGAPLSTPRVSYGPTSSSAPTQPGGSPFPGPLLTQPPAPASPSIPLAGHPAGMGAGSPFSQPLPERQPFTAGPALGSASQSPRWRVPDAPGAAIPKPVSKRRRQWLRLSLRRRVVYVAAAVVLVLGIVASGAYFVTHRPQPPQAQTVAFGNVTRTGSVDVSRLTDLTQTNGAAPQGQATLPVLPMQPGLSGQASADHNTSIAPLPATIADTIADGSERRLESKFAPNERQVGLRAPIDVSLGASDQYVVETVDGIIQIFGYNGQTDGPELAAADFFGPVVQSGDALGQLRVLFDHPSQRWVVVANETKSDNSGVSTSYFDVAISQDVQPLAVWSLYQISTQEGAPVQCSWADDPQLGSDGTAFYLSGNSFGCGSNAAFRGSMLWALPKKTFLTGKANQFLRWQGVFNNAQHKPVFSVAPAVEAGGDGVEWLLSDDAGYVTGSKTSSQVIVWSITNPQVMESGKIPSLVGVVVNLSRPYADPPAAIQAGSSNPVNTGDARFTTPILAGGHLYAAFTTAMNWQGDGTTRSAAYWLDLSPTVLSSGTSGTGGTATQTGQSGNPKTVVKVNQSGIFGFAGGYTFYPTLAADASGNVALLVGAASPGITPSLLLGWRHAGDASGTMGSSGDTVRLQAGAQDAPYADSHWGDYMGAAFTPGGSISRPTVWVAGPYMTDYPTQWQTLVWQMPV